MSRGFLRAVRFTGQLVSLLFGFIAVWTALPLVMPVEEPYPWIMYVVSAVASAGICYAAWNLAAEADERLEGGRYDRET